VSLEASGLGRHARPEERGLTEKEEAVGLLSTEGPETPFLEIEELRALVAAGRERGFLTFEEIAGCLEEVEVTKEQVRALHVHLVDGGVEIISSEGRQPAPAASGDGGGRQDAASPQPKRPEIDLTVEPSLDSLRLYLRAIGRVDLLTADQ
jgi:RNA polymerase primary sigma factor